MFFFVKNAKVSHKICLLTFQFATIPAISYVRTARDNSKTCPNNVIRKV